MRWKQSALMLAILATAGVLALAAAPAARTADHLDAPDLSPPDGNLMGDIADLFVFPPDADKNNQVVLAATYNPAAGVFGPTGFDPGLQYTFEIDTDGDARAERTITFEFDETRNNGRQDYSVWLDGGELVAGTTETVANFGDTGKAFAGLADDPFFFDLDAFLGSGGRAFCDGSEADFFAGLNVNAIVVQVPVDMIADGALGVWARTLAVKDNRGLRQVDRIGFPALNTVFIPSRRKDVYNAGIPANDEDDFFHFLRRGFKGGGNSTATSKALADALLPDILPYDPSLPAGFLNGRRLVDDVIDAELGLLTAGALTGDCVDGNDVDFSDTFPYLGHAH